MLLQEIAIRYPPKQGMIQLTKDYYATFSLWKNAGSGAMSFGKPPTTHTRTKIVDELFRQVTDEMVLAINDRVKGTAASGDKELISKMEKDISKINREHKLEDWLNLHATITDILGKYFLNKWALQRRIDIENDPTSVIMQLSPVVKNIVQANKQVLPKSKSEDEPAPIPAPPPEPTPPPPPPTPKGPELTWPKDLPPLPQDATREIESKRIPANYENMLKKFEYEWSEEDNAYKREKTGTLLKIRGDYSSVASIPGKPGRKEFPSLGKLFIQLSHARKRDKKHSVSESYKTLFEFLYN